MSVPVLVHRWFSDKGEAWAFHSSLKSIFPTLRDKLKGQASALPGRVAPIEIPNLKIILAGFRETDIDRPKDEFGRPLVVLRIAVLSHIPSEAEFDVLELMLRDCPLPNSAGISETLEIAALPVIQEPALTMQTPLDSGPVEELDGPDENGSDLNDHKKSRPTLSSIGQYLKLALLICFIGFALGLGWKLIPRATIVQEPERQTERKDENKGWSDATSSSDPKPPSTPKGLSSKELNLIHRAFQEAIDRANDHDQMLTELKHLQDSKPGFRQFLVEQASDVATYLANRSRQITLAKRRESFRDPDFDRKQIVRELLADKGNLRGLREFCLQLGGSSKSWPDADDQFGSLNREYDVLLTKALVEPLKVAFKTLTAKFEYAKRALSLDRQMGTRKFENERTELVKAMSHFEQARLLYVNSSRSEGNQPGAKAFDERQFLDDAIKIKEWLKTLSSPETWKFHVSLPKGSRTSALTLIQQIEGQPIEIELQPSNDGTIFHLQASSDSHLYYEKRLEFYIDVVDSNNKTIRKTLMFETDSGRSDERDAIQILCNEIAFFKIKQERDL